jgi:hypothetical protein
VAHGSDFFSAAIEASGYSTNLIYRFLAVLRFVDAELLPKAKVTERAISKLPFATVELIRRAWKLDPSTAERWLRLSEGARSFCPGSARARISR